MLVDPARHPLSAGVGDRRGAELDRVSAHFTGTRVRTPRKRGSTLPVRNEFRTTAPLPRRQARNYFLSRSPGRTRTTRARRWPEWTVT